MQALVTWFAHRHQVCRPIRSPVFHLPTMMHMQGSILPLTPFYPTTKPVTTPNVASQILPPPPRIPLPTAHRRSNCPGHQSHSAPKRRRELTHLRGRETREKKAMPSASSSGNAGTLPRPRLHVKHERSKQSDTRAHTHHHAISTQKLTQN